MATDHEIATGSPEGNAASRHAKQPRRLPPTPAATVGESAAPDWDRADGLWCFAKLPPARRVPSHEQGADLDRMTESWIQRVIGADRRGGWSEHARASILYADDGIVTAAGIAEGFATAGASTGTLVFLGAAVILAGGLAAAGARIARNGPGGR